MEGLWILFCGCAEFVDEKPCNPSFGSFTNPSSCSNHILITFFNVLLLFMILLNTLYKMTTKQNASPNRNLSFSHLQISSAVFNGLLGILYLSFGSWILEEKLRKTESALPLSDWFVVLFQGFTWLVVGLMGSLNQTHFVNPVLRMLSIVTFLFATVLCFFSLSSVVSTWNLTIKLFLDIASFPGAVLLLLSVYKASKDRDGFKNDLYTPLNGARKSFLEDQVTPFAQAGIFSKITFWWLNSLMKRGTEKTLEDKDIPNLGESDTAEACYTSFVEQLNRQENKTLILRTIVLCHWKDIVKSGSFAMMKILTVSAGPLLLNAFINVAEGKERFKYEGYFLALLLFICKSLESVSQRQWYFRSRLIGLKVRSLLSAAIYKKQLRLSNSSRMVHSGGEIMNYVTVDAYRIGEFPFWFHQTWTTSLQLCIALVILFHAVGLATIASLIMIIITVLCNAPMAKLQHKYQSRLMVAQDERLNSSSEALVNMKVLKLYAWEIHFKKVIENLRKTEYKWLRAVQLRRAYNGFLFWSSPVLVSAATFAACYFLNIPLHASNVFTFVATLRLVQDPIRSIPDVIGVVIQANVAFSRIVKFLEASELQSGHVRRKSILGGRTHIVSIDNADFSWEQNAKTPTLRNVNLKIKPSEKVAICGEVGSGKSTLLSAILGEVPNTQGSVSFRCKTPFFVT